jgi:hypothetical protein
MTRDQAMLLLSDFLEGTLDASEHEAIARMLESDAELRNAFEEEKVIDQLLRTQVWVTPKPDFTTRVLTRAGLPAPRGEMLLDIVLERLSAYAPVGTLVLILLLYGRAIAGTFWRMWQGICDWGVAALGMATLEKNPALPVVTLVMVAAILVISFELGRHSHSSA